MANPDKMIKPYPRYWKLYQRRGEDPAKIDFEDAIRFFSWKDYLDIQVYYNLVWFGFKAREEFPEINRMLSLTASGSLFTEDDKYRVLAMQMAVIKRLLYKIRNCPKNVELTATPFFHPILPLLIDTDIAKRCMPDVKLPKRLQMPDHAFFQVQHGVTFFENIVGRLPNGMWPAEGSVCPEAIPLFEKAGVKWIATDEGILAKSGVKGKREDYLYQPYTAEHDGSNITMVFRDREISDLIGFSYAKMNGDDAVNDFLSKVSAAFSMTNLENPLITVLLDGENAWEHYEENGKKFLTSLLSGLRKSGIKTTTISSYLAEHPPKNKITKLHSGSWIDSNYRIWIGKDQKNQAWGYVKRTVDELGKKLSAVLRKDDRSAKELLALETFGAACGSDWFWWFDDDFQSEFKSDFDKIFRMHLKNVFSLLSCDIPLFLYEPIHHYKDKENGHAQDQILPQAFIYPVIDGYKTSFFEWSNAVKLDVGRHRGPMGQTEELFETIYFGFNTEAFFLRFDSLKKEPTLTLSDNEEIVVYIHNKQKFKAHLFHDGSQYKMEYSGNQEDGYIIPNSAVNWSMNAVLEAGFNFKDLSFNPGEKITVIITVFRGGLEVRHYSHIHFIVPDETYERQMWSV